MMMVYNLVCTMRGDAVHESKRTSGIASFQAAR